MLDSSLVDRNDKSDVVGIASDLNARQIFDGTKSQVDVNDEQNRAHHRPLRHAKMNVHGCRCSRRSIKNNFPVSEIGAEPGASGAVQPKSSQYTKKKVVIDAVKRFGNVNANGKTAVAVIRGLDDALVQKGIGNLGGEFGTKTKLAIREETSGVEMFR